MNIIKRRKKKKVKGIKHSMRKQNSSKMLKVLNGLYENNYNKDI